MEKYFNWIIKANGQAVSSATIVVTSSESGGAVIYASADGAVIADSTVYTNASGYFFFYAPSGKYILSISGTGISPYVITDVSLYEETPNSQVIVGTPTAVTVPIYKTNGTMQVMINGLPQIIGASYSYLETNSTTITFNEALTAGDVVTVRR